MGPDQMSGGALHALVIQGPVNPDRAMTRYRRAGIAVENHIAIAAAGGREARVKFLIDRMGPVNADFRGKIDIASQHPISWCSQDVGIEMDYLAKTVDTGIRPARTMNPDQMVSHSRNRSLQALLDRIDAHLGLPAVERRPVILHTHRQTHPSPHCIPVEKMQKKRRTAVRLSLF